MHEVAQVAAYDEADLSLGFVVPHQWEVLPKFVEFAFSLLIGVLPTYRMVLNFRCVNWTKSGNFISASRSICSSISSNGFLLCWILFHTHSLL